MGQKTRTELKRENRELRRQLRIAVAAAKLNGATAMRLACEKFGKSAVDAELRRANERGSN